MPTPYLPVWWVTGYNPNPPYIISVMQLQIRFAQRFILVLLVFLLSTASEVLAATETPQDTFAGAVDLLKASAFNKKAKAIARLQGLDDPRSLPILKALFQGNLYIRTLDERLVIAEPRGSRLVLTDVVSSEQIGVVVKDELKKIVINNQLRRTLRGAIARLSLSSKEAERRLTAVQEIIHDLDEQASELLRAALAKEEDTEVREALATGLALIELDSPNPAIRQVTIERLSGSLNPTVHNRLTALLNELPEQDERLRAAVRRALNAIELKLGLYSLIETLFFGLSLGSVLVLAAIGLAITFGVMGVINMAHGELIMLGAYTTYVIQLLMPNHIDLSLFIAVPAAFMVSALFGIAIERGVIRFLYGRPLETLLATFGVSLILQQLVRTIFSPLNRSVFTPAWMSGSLEINSALSLTYNRLYIMVFGLLVFFALLVILKKTTLGLQVRAVAQNRAMARAMGVRTEWVDAITFGLGSGIAGVAGVALSQITNVGPNLGQAYIIDSFMVVVFGGVGNLWGTLVGGLSLGVANKFLEPYAGAVLAKILVLVFIIIYIQKRPRGLFPQKGRAAEG
jgi:urea transport system permease protein